MLRAILRPSHVLHVGLLSYSLLSSATFHNGAASEAAMTSSTMTSSAAASLWLQNSNANDGASVAMHTQQADAAGAAAAETQDNGSALVVLGDSTSSGLMDDFTSSFSPRHSTEVAMVPESARAKSHRSRGQSHKADLAAASADTSFSSAAATAAVTASLPRHAGGDDGTVARRPVITKARRIRLASAASQAAEVLQTVGSPATALILSQRVQQLQAEEALLNASLQRLKAERDLATVRHTCGEELNNYRRGVQQREQLVVRAAMNGGTHSEDPVVSYSQESGGVAGGDTLQTLVEADLLGMPATADAEAAAAAAAARKSVQKSRRASHTAAVAISAKKRLRDGATPAGVRKTKAAPKSLPRGGVKPEASKAKRPSPAKQATVKARAAKPGKTPAVGRKHSAKVKAKAPSCMQAETSVRVVKTAAAKIAKKIKSVKAKSSASAAATAQATAHRQRAKVNSAAMKSSRTRSVPAPPAKNARLKAYKAVAQKKTKKKR
ncbi:hypothetical protein GH5_07273 [Leishmania sp. Ghana 2012 LV757]|uniref:hypothetical protein n=1 Tax=Leishmania sp. Ghana 2012 LV757 TaxID=2803181 RepID=UPI001B6352E9|nr:hypothetical protein GH5_07273 [Leishmania sp. Ghana 2012 LV757]